ncbi:hypothetical protein V6N12_035646 [Hibiscus sabdariffa]|uniref:Uncharacterized protein n=1 Tax=Hibiscus sabdariffa TaxID=183260 RepID=A0ABR2ENB9_9ROSI
MCSVLKLDDGQWCSNQSIIRQKVVEFFKKVFSASSITGWDFHGCFPSLLTCDVMRRTDAMRRTAAIGDDEAGDIVAGGVVGYDRVSSCSNSSGAVTAADCAYLD